MAGLALSACGGGAPAPLATANTDTTGGSLLATQKVPFSSANDQRLARAQRSATDRALELRLNDLLIFDASLLPSEVSLRSSDGHVTISGRVEQLADGERAACLVEHFPGVYSVDNQLVLRGNSVTDFAIEGSTPLFPTLGRCSFSGSIASPPL